MVRSRLAVSAVAALAIGSIALAPVPRSGATASGSIGFEVPSVVDPIHTNGEPDIAIDPQGRVFNSGPTGTGSSAGPGTTSSSSVSLSPSSVPSRSTRSSRLSMAPGSRPSSSSVSRISPYELRAADGRLRGRGS